MLHQATLEVVNLIKEKGGRAMLIGGAVIESIKGGKIKDWDIEVYGLEWEELISILSAFGTPNLVGKSFGVIKINIDGIDYDFSLPRKDSKTGEGHNGFNVKVDPNMSPMEAGKRRDLTINSMYLNLHTLEIIDPFGGLEDLEKGILRATDHKTFIEDPLRVLRIMQLLPRKAKTAERATIDLCASMVDSFSELPSERLFVEWEKLLMKSDKPSLGLGFLRDCGWIKHFPALFDLIGCPQNPEWHPEGDVWIHTNMVVDNAARLRHLVDEDWRLAFMFGALLHDVGKPSTTVLPECTAYGHDREGIAIAEAFMNQLTNNRVLIERVKTIVGLHMRAGQLHSSGAKDAAWKRLHNKCRLDVLGMISKADSAGRTGRSIEDKHGVSEMCLHWFNELGEKPVEPLVKGRDLIALGMKPSPEFGAILKGCFDLQIEGMSKDAILADLKESMILPVKFKVFE